MRVSTVIMAFAVFFISACTQESSLRTTIPGLDLSKIQNEEYFRKNPDASRQFVLWCKDSMVPPIPADKTSQMFHKNCRFAATAVLFPSDNLTDKKDRKYNGYGLLESPKKK